MSAKGFAFSCLSSIWVIQLNVFMIRCWWTKCSIEEWNVGLEVMRLVYKPIQLRWTTDAIIKSSMVRTMLSTRFSYWFSKYLIEFSQSNFQVLSSSQEKINKITSKFSQLSQSFRGSSCFGMANRIGNKIRTWWIWNSGSFRRVWSPWQQGSFGNKIRTWRIWNFGSFEVLGRKWRRWRWIRYGSCWTIEQRTRKLWEIFWKCAQSCCEENIEGKQTRIDLQDLFPNIRGTTKFTSSHRRSSHEDSWI